MPWLGDASPHNKTIEKRRRRRRRIFSLHGHSNRLGAYHASRRVASSADTVLSAVYLMTQLEEECKKIKSAVNVSTYKKNQPRHSSTGVPCI